MMLILRRQSWLGDGLQMQAKDLFGEGQSAPKAPRVMATTSAAALMTPLSRSQLR